VLHVRSLEIPSSAVNDEHQPAAMMAGCHSTSADELTSECLAPSISSCSAGARDTHTADSSDVLAIQT